MGTSTGTSLKNSMDRFACDEKVNLAELWDNRESFEKVLKEKMKTRNKLKSSARKAIFRNRNRWTKSDRHWRVFKHTADEEARMNKLIHLGNHRHMMQHALDGVVTEPFLKKLVQLKKKHNKKRKDFFRGILM